MSRDTRRLVRALRGAGLFAWGVAVGRLVRLDNERGAYRRAWEDHALATLAWLDSLPREGPARADSLRPLVMVALGDSAAQGIGASKVSGGYVPRFAAAVQQATGRPVALLNLSMSGATTESLLLTQIPQLRGLDLASREITPDLYTLNIGGNDVGVADMPVELFARRLGRVLDALPAGVFVGNLSSFGRFRGEARAARMSQVIDRLAGAHGDHVVDLRALSQSYTAAQYMLRYHAADMFHPNDAAYREWAQLFADAWARVAGVGHVDAGRAPEWSMRSMRVAQSGA